MIAALILAYLSVRSTKLGHERRAKEYEKVAKWVGLAALLALIFGLAALWHTTTNIVEARTLLAYCTDGSPVCGLHAADLASARVTQSVAIALTVAGVI